MKIAISGKGGVGKTTICALLIKAFSQAGFKVYAVDADPSGHLAGYLGFPENPDLIPLMEMSELIQERMGVSGSGVSPFFKLNPQLADLPEKYALEKNGIRLMVLGGIKAGGSGCACPENLFFKNLLNEIITSRQEVVIVDMEAGLEHLQRGTAEAVDLLLIVLEPNPASLKVGEKAAAMAKELKIKNTGFVVNKVLNPQQFEFIKTRLSPDKLLAALPFSQKIISGELKAEPVFERDEEITRLGEALFQKIKATLEGGKI